jgi:nucleotide-binding universal stress UspA family protein
VQRIRNLCGLCRSAAARCDAAGRIVPEAEDESTRRAEAVWNLRSVLAERLPAGVRSQPVLRMGDAATEIVRTAREEGCDLIVLTTHGACGWREGVLGSVAEEVLCHAPCPVLTISGPASGNRYVARNALLGQATGAMRPELAVASKHKLYLDGD